MSLFKSFRSRRVIDDPPGRIDHCADGAGPGSIGGFDRSFLFFLHQPFGQREQLRAMAAIAEREEAFHQPETEGGRLIGVQRSKLGWHLDAIHY